MEQRLEHFRKLLLIYLCLVLGMVTLKIANVFDMQWQDILLASQLVIPALAALIAHPAAGMSGIKKTHFNT